MIKKNQDMKLLSFFLLLLIILLSSTQGVADPYPIDIRGYVYYGTYLVQPDKVIAHISEKEYGAILPYETQPTNELFGYYVFQNITANQGDLIIFDVTLSGIDYLNVGSLTININPIYSSVNLTVPFIVNKYDVNKDGVVDFQDAGLVWIHRSSQVPYETYYDMNDDGVVDFQDAGIVWIHRDM